MPVVISLTAIPRVRYRQLHCCAPAAVHFRSAVLVLVSQRRLTSATVKTQRPPTRRGSQARSAPRRPDVRDTTVRTLNGFTDTAP